MSHPLDRVASKRRLAVLMSVLILGQRLASAIFQIHQASLYNIHLLEES
jgi:hypothetical protein